jgi:hypothetical protein
MLLLLLLHIRARQVYTDSFGDAHGVQATAEKPFPPGALQPMFSSYEYATGCQTVYVEVLGGFPYYFPACVSFRVGVYPRNSRSRRQASRFVLVRA